MRMCMDHWRALKDAIAERGMERFVAADGKTVIERLTGQNANPGEDFEPLMGAHNAILNNVLRLAGLDAMRPNDDGSDRCPLCFLINNCQCGRGDECPFRSFIMKAADEQLARARELKLLPEPA